MTLAISAILTVDTRAFDAGMKAAGAQVHHFNLRTGEASASALQLASALTNVAQAQRVATAAQVAAAGVTDDAHIARQSAALAQLTQQQKLNILAQDTLAAAAGRGEAAQRAATQANLIAAASTPKEVSDATIIAARNEATEVARLSNEMIAGMEDQIAANERLAKAKARGGDITAVVAREEYRLNAQRKLGVAAVEELNKVMATYDRLQASNAEKANGSEKLSGFTEEVEALKERNRLLAEQAAGGQKGAKATARLKEMEANDAIDKQVQAKRKELTDIGGLTEGVIEHQLGLYEAQLKQLDVTKKQIEIQTLATKGVESLTGVLTGIAGEDWGSVASGFGSLLSDFNALEIQTGSTGAAFSALGDKLLQSAAAGNALGNIVGNILGRSEQQNKNAQIGGTVGGAIGSQFGPAGKAIGSFLGNIIGGLFGPGKSDSTAGVDIDTNTGKIVNFDTKKKKQNEDNMTARDGLAGSILEFTTLLREATGGMVADMVAVQVGSRDGNRWRVQDNGGQILASGTTAVGDIKGTLSAVLAAVTQTLTGVSDELKARLTSIDFSNLERAQADVGFVLSYADAIKSLNGELEGGSDAVAAARKTVVDMLNQVRDFGATAARLGYDSAVTNAALRADVERFAGIRNTVEPMTEIETRIAALKAGFGALAPVLEAVGYSVADAQTAVIQGLARKTEEVKRDFVQGLDREFNEQAGNGFINQLNDLKTTRDTRYRDADAVGADRGIVDRNVNVGLSKIVTPELRVDQLAEIVRLYSTEFPEAAAVAQTALDRLAGAVTNVGDAAAQAARNAATSQVLDSLADRRATATGEADTQDGALAIFDRAATRELATIQQRVATGELAASALTATEQTLAVERLAITQRFAKDMADRESLVTRGLADRVAALAFAQDPDGEIKLLERKQNAEFAAAIAAGHTADQLRVLADVLGGEMVQAVGALQKRRDEVTRGLDDRAAALAFAQDPDGEIKLLERKQNAEFAAAIAAGHTADQLQKLASVLGGEMTQAVKAVTERLAEINRGVADRLFTAQNDTSSLSGDLEKLEKSRGDGRTALSRTKGGDLTRFDADTSALRQDIQARQEAAELTAFDRQTARERAELAKTAGADLVGFDQGTALLRLAIQRRYNQQSVDGEQARAQQLAALNQSIADRLFNATNDNTTLIGALAEFDRKTARERDDIARTAGADLVSFDAAVAIERGDIQRRFNSQAIELEKQRVEALTAAGGGLRQWVDNIRATTGTPEQTLAAVRSQYQTQLALAQGGNIDAVQGLKDYAQRLIDAETKQTASGLDRRAIVDGILAQVEALPAVKTYDQLILEELQKLQGGVTVGVSLTVLRTITETLNLLPEADRTRLIQAQTVVRAIEDRLGRALTPTELDLLVEGGAIAREVEQWLGRDLTATERAALLQADIVERRIEQELGRQLTPAEAATLIQPGAVQRLIGQTINAPTGTLVSADPVNRTVNQNLTINGTVLTSDLLSRDIALELANVEFQGQAIANRYLAAIAFNTARVIGVGGGGMFITAGPGANQPEIRDLAGAAQLNVPPPIVSTPIVSTSPVTPTTPDAELNYRDGYNRARDQRYLNTYRDVASAVVNGQFASGWAHYDLYGRKELRTYARGTDFHPGGWALVGEEGPELVELPRGASVRTAAETVDLFRAGRSASKSIAGGSGDDRGLTQAVERQNALIERQNLLLEQIVTNSADGADASAEMARALKSTPRSGKVGTVKTARAA